MAKQPTKPVTPAAASLPASATPKRTQPPFAATTRPVTGQRPTVQRAPEPEPEPEVEETSEETVETTIEQDAELAEQLEAHNNAPDETQPEEPEAEGGEVEVDESLFPDPSLFAEAAGIWDEGGNLEASGRPVGQFVARIEVAELTRSASTDRLQIHYKLVLPDGVEIHKYDGLGTPQQAQITRSQLERLGIKTAGLQLQTLPATLLQLVGRNAKIKTQMNKEYYNIYFQGIVNDPIGGTAAEARGAVGRVGGKPAAGAPRRF